MNKYFKKLFFHKSDKIHMTNDVKGFLFFLLIIIFLIVRLLGNRDLNFECLY